VSSELRAAFWRGARRGAGYGGLFGGFVGFALCCATGRFAYAALYGVAALLSAGVLDQIREEK
jgi:hypothetical protein